jgi:hypothetical protein
MATSLFRSSAAILLEAQTAGDRSFLTFCAYARRLPSYRESESESEFDGTGLYVDTTTSPAVFVFAGFYCSSCHNLHITPYQSRDSIATLIKCRM